MFSTSIVLRRYIYIVSLFLSLSSYGQFGEIVEINILPNRGDTIQLDSGFILQPSISISGYSQFSDYRAFENKLIWMAKTPQDSIPVTFQKLDFKIVYQNKDKSIIQREFRENPFSYTPSSSSGQTDYGDLQTAGNVSRGVGFGNNQDVVVNSNLNLRIRGTVADDVDVLAVISDENNPIQPEGNTQQIQDFDQVYITLSRDSSKLTMGDFLMKRPQHSYFLNYYKKNRGLQFENVLRKGNDWRVHTQAEIAMSRGRFSRNRIEGIEGNAGPYRLSGENGEIFIIVIAGTENVYLDGKQLTRGENQDYVINYNTGEITFTPRILITRYSRIVVEFQYSDRNYGRSVAHLGSSVSKENYTVYANFFNEMDLKSQPFQQSLEAFDSSNNISARELLASAGDSLAFFPRAVRQEAYSNERIMYTRVQGGSDFIYIYAPDPGAIDTFYEVSFTNVGLNRGSYIQAQTGANGKVFEYVGPSLGNYSPVEVLIAPTSLTSFNLGLVYESENKATGIEYSLSSKDLNTFSSINDNNNSGFGLKLFRRTERRLRDSSDWDVHSNIDYELVSGRYNFVERYRGVEFDRQWNKVLENPTALSAFLPSFEHIANASFGLRKDNFSFISNQSSYFLRPANFSGLSNTTRGALIWNKISLNSSLEILQSESNQSDSNALQNDFYSLGINIERPIRNIVLGFGLQSEQSAFKSDSLESQSYGFDQYRGFIRNGDSSKFNYQLTAAQRTDRLPKNEGFSTSTIGRDIGFQSNYSSKKNQRIDLSTIYRQLEITNTTLSSTDVENTLQSRLELNLKFLKNLIRSRIFYEISTGQEQRREFQYLKVQPGNGVYVWNDYDSNGLKTLNEFEIASELDRPRADHIKIFTPVAGFFTTQANRISQTLEINPAVFRKSRQKSIPFYSRFNSLTTLILDRKALPTDVGAFLNPFEQNLEDTSLINSSQNLRSTLFFNRGNSKYSLDYTYISGNSKVLLTNGFDSRSNVEHVLNSRINLGRQFTLNTRLRGGEKLFESQFFTANNYQYSFLEVQPKLQVLFKQLYRIELLTKYFSAANEEAFGGETSESIEVGGNFKYAKATKGTLDASASFIRVNYDGSASSNLGYELLRGLQDGNNATWRLGYQRTLANNIQVVLSYDGRKSEDAPIIHLGRLVARYLF